MTNDEPTVPAIGSDQKSDQKNDNESISAQTEVVQSIETGKGSVEGGVMQDNLESDVQTESESDRSVVLVNGEKLSKWPEDLYIPPDALEVFLETFQGPLDLLLYLIRKQNLDILDIPVAHITRQYMDYVELMRHFRLDLAAEYLVMAAMLAEIKSRMLLPRPESGEDGEEEDPRAALVKRLQEYERFNKASQDINDLSRVDREIYLVSAAFDDPAPVKIQARASVNDLVLAFRNVLERNERNQSFSMSREVLTVREKMTLILEKVRRGTSIRFETLFDPDEGKLGLVVSFMAVLELVRDDMLYIVQNEPFTPIHIKGVEEGSD
ncbi:MAG: ScpA family protein [Pseudomonadota bacterium]